MLKFWFIPVKFTIIFKDFNCKAISMTEYVAPYLCSFYFQVTRAACGLMVDI